MWLLALLTLILAYAVWLALRFLVPDGPAPVDVPPVPPRAASAASVGAPSFGASNYKRMLAKTPTPTKAKIKEAVRDLLHLYAPGTTLEADCQGHDVDTLLSEASYVGSRRFRGLATVYSKFTRSEREKAMWAVLRLWTSGAVVRTIYGRMELCSLLNRALREDQTGPLRHALVITRALTMFCCRGENREQVTGFYSRLRRQLRRREADWPNGLNSDLRDVTYRGGGLPAAHRGFFRAGRRFRCPCFVASSFRKATALKFMARQSHPCVLWTLRFDPTLRCLHVNLIRALDGGQFQDEQEFLLSPYTAFEVLEVAPATRGTEHDPHRVTLAVAADNLDLAAWPEDLPTSPWL